MPASPVFFGRRERQGWGGAGRGQRQKSACVLPHGGAEARLLGPNPACSPHRLGASLSAPPPPGLRWVLKGQPARLPQDAHSTAMSRALTCKATPPASAGSTHPSGSMVKYEPNTSADLPADHGAQAQDK